MFNQFRWELLSAGDKVLVAVSGGPDSLALLHRLWTEREARQLHVEAAHLDHSLRGGESAAEADWMAAWCREREIACHVGKEDVAAWASAHKQSKQEAARTVRYAFLERTADSVGADKIATGHTRDDQAETVLGHILRGTGLNGLRGIPMQRGPIIRPLLGVSRAEIEEYCAAQDLHPRQDASNLSSDHYTRNRLRLELLPLLRRDYNVRVEDALLRLSEIAARDSEYLEVQAQTALSEVTRVQTAGFLQINRAALAALHPALLRSVLRLALEQVRGTGTGVTYEHLEAVCRAAVAPPRVFALTLPAPACRVHVGGNRVTLTLPVPPSFSSPAVIPLPVPGEVVLSDAGWCVRADWQEQAGAVAVSAKAVDLASLAVRTWQVGDKIDTLGLGGKHQKLSDIFTNAKVPRAERVRIPLVTDRRGILWIAGHTLSERVRVSEEMEQALYLSVRPVQVGENFAGENR